MKKIFSLFAAVLFAGSMMAQAPVGTTLFSEDFSSFAKDAVPSGQVTTATGRVVYGNATVTYTTGGSNSKIYEEAIATGTSPEILIGKNGGSLTIEGIPSGGAKEITVSYKQNKQKLKVESTTTGYTGSKEEKPADVGANSFDITVADGSAATFDLVFTCTGSSNVRVDDIAVTVKTAGEGGGDTPQEDTWTVAGSSSVAFGTTWDPANTANDMVKQNDGTFKWEKENLELADGSVDFKVAKNHSWDEAYPSQDYKLAIDAAGIYTISITFEPENNNNVSATATKTGEAVVVPTVVMHGTFVTSDWADTEAFAKSEDKKSASLKLTLAAGDIEFGMKLDGAWKANGATLTRENASTSLASGSGNMHLTADVDGEYTFTYTYETQTLEVTFPKIITVMTCAEAAEAAATAGDEIYKAKGYVTEIAYALSNGSMSFWMADTEDGGRVLEAYKCAVADEADAPKVGDLVIVTGQLTVYQSTKEFKQGCTVEIVERAAEPVNLGEKTIAEFLQLKNTKDTCVLTGKVTEIVNDQYGNLTIEDATGSLYVYGVLTPAGESKKFSTLDVAVNDVLTIKATYNEYNDTPQAKNAIFVSREKATETAVDNATVAGKAQKMIIDGQLFIIRDGVMFNANGAAVK